MSDLEHDISMLLDQIVMIKNCDEIESVEMLIVKYINFDTILEFLENKYNVYFQ